MHKAHSPSARPALPPPPPPLCCHGRKSHVRCESSRVIIAPVASQGVRGRFLGAAWPPAPVAGGLLEGTLHVAVAPRLLNRRPRLRLAARCARCGGTQAGLLISHPPA